MSEIGKKATGYEASGSTFPVKLHYMLTDMKADGLEAIASWQPHGRCFIVHRPKLFEIKIIPFYFQQSKYTSFQRQLNFYNFRRITDGIDKGGYYHPSFQRDRSDLLGNMKRNKAKGVTKVHQGITKPKGSKPKSRTNRSDYRCSFVQDSNAAKFVSEERPILTSTDLTPKMPSQETSTSNEKLNVKISLPYCSVLSQSVLLSHIEGQEIQVQNHKANVLGLYKSPLILHPTLLCTHSTVDSLSGFATSSVYNDMWSVEKIYDSLNSTFLRGRDELQYLGKPKFF